ncbi:MAG TPA: hypothetical protein VIV58_27375 [Kofleriaceae bacterium]
MRAEPIASPHLGDTHVSGGGLALADEVSPVLPQPSAEAQHLRVATDQLIREGELDPRRVSEALRALASVLEKLTPNADVDIERVDLAADALDRSDPDSLRRLRFGLDAARHALASAPAPAHADVPRFLVEVAELRDESAKLTADLSLAMQYSQVCAAFRAAVRAVFAADGAEAPTFAESGATAQR